MDCSCKGFTEDFRTSEVLHIPLPMSAPTEIKFPQNRIESPLLWVGL